MDAQAKLRHLENTKRASSFKALRRASTETQLKCVRAITHGRSNATAGGVGRSSCSTFQQILHAVENAKHQERAGSDSASFNHQKDVLRRRFTSETSGAMGSEGFSELRQQMRGLAKGQEAGARRVADLLSRSEALEQHQGVIDQKLELILEIVSRGHMAGEAASPLVAASHEDQHTAGNGRYERITEAGQVLPRRMRSLTPRHTHAPAHVHIADVFQVLHRRRKVKAGGALRSALAMQRLAAPISRPAAAEGMREGRHTGAAADNGQPNTTAAVPPCVQPAASMTGFMAAARAAQQDRTRHEDEREELREALNA